MFLDAHLTNLFESVMNSQGATDAIYLYLYILPHALADILGRLAHRLLGATERL